MASENNQEWCASGQEVVFEEGKITTLPLPTEEQLVYLERAPSVPGPKGGRGEPPATSAVGKCCKTYINKNRRPY